MSKNNFESLQPYITKSVLVIASKYLDEFEDSVYKSTLEANELVLNQIFDNIKNTDKINLVFENVKKIKPNVDNILENIAQTLSDQSILANLSNNFLELFFDLKKDTYSKMVAKNNFIKPESANAVIKMSAVLILCYLAKNNLNSTTIVSHFETKKNIEPVITTKTAIDPQPEQTTKTDVKKQKEPAKVVPSQESKIVETKPKNKILIYAAVAILVISIVFFGFINNDKTDQNNGESTTETPADSETQSQTIEGTNVTELGDFIDFTLPSDDIITIPEKGVEKALLDLILDKSKGLDESSFWLCLDRTYFDGRNIDYKVDSEEQLKNLSLILNSFPKLELNIGCYTDNLGDDKSNLELTVKRAESIKNGLIKLGVTENRLRTEGFGESFPITDNSNAINQKTNRRVSIKIINK